MLPASAVPVITGVVSLVIWDATVGVAGSVVSIVNSRLVTSMDEFPAASVLVTETSFDPFTFGANVPASGVNTPVSTLQSPEPSAVTVYDAPPTTTVTVLLASAVPEISGVVSLVV